MFKNLLLPAILLLLSYILHSCANIAPPGGGPKDVKPPFVQKSYPANNTKSFNQKKITLYFNERITTNNLTDELIINPSIKGEYRSSIKKNVLTLTFDKEFNPNTTYTLNFRDGIKDITENNTAKNLRMAFSTGIQLDTVMLQGDVIDLVTNMPIANALISLYVKGDTSTVTKSAPVYFTKSDKTGRFSINNIKKGSYDLFAFTDYNKNYIYDNVNEKIAFKKDIQLDTVSTYVLLPAKSQLGNIKLQGKKALSGVESVVNFNNGLVSVAIEGENKNKLLLQITDNRRGIIFYSPKPINDSIPITINVEDSLGNAKKESIYIEFKEFGKSKNNTPKEKILIIKKIVPADKQLIPGKFNFAIHFSRPISEFNPKGISLKKDSLLQKNNVLIATWDTNHTKLTLSTKNEVKFKDSLVLQLPKGTVISIEGDTNTAEKYIFTNKIESAYAILDGSIKTSEKSYLLQLVDNNNQVIEERVNPKTFNFNFIQPGNYVLRVIIDTNNNQKWDTGSLERNTQPEEIIFYKEKFNLRANWEITGIEFTF